jgi:hypothetical protein
MVISNRRLHFVVSCLTQIGANHNLVNRLCYINRRKSSKETTASDSSQGQVEPVMLCLGCASLNADLLQNHGLTGEVDKRPIPLISRNNQGT